MDARLLYAFEDGRLPEEALGRKAVGLLRLYRLRLRVPKTWVVTYDGYRRYLANDEAVVDQLVHALDASLDPAPTYAVRSSASLEDEAYRTFAGQFKTALDLSGTQAIVQAIWSVWATATSDAVAAYLQRMGQSREELLMAVIVQEMVRSQVAGVAFSRNPVTGRDEVVIEGVRGLGTTLMQGGVTPLRWVYRWGRWMQAPDAIDIPVDIMGVVAEQTAKVANKIGYDVDLEWAWDGEQLYWLQMRQITSVRDIRVYSNAISKEMLPGMIKPLVWSVNVPQTNGAWVDLMTEVIGKNDIDPASLAKQFHYRAYFDTSTFGRVFESLGMAPDSLDRMVGVRSGGGKPQRPMPGPRMLRHVPRMVRFLARMWTIEDQARQALLSAQSSYDAIPVVPGDDLDERALLSRLDVLDRVHRSVIRYSVVVPLLLRTYEALLNKGLARAGVDPATLDLVAGLQGLEDYDLPSMMARLNALFRELSLDVQHQIRGGIYGESRQLPGLTDLQAGVDALLERFGHLSDSVTDFSNETWREQPDTVLRLIADYPISSGAAAARTRFEDLSLKGLGRGWVRLLYRRARRFRVLRDIVSHTYARGFGLIRATYLALGERFVRRGLLEARDDIFYLYEDEVRQCVAGDVSGEGVPALVQQRKAEMALSRDAELPPVIYGDQPPPLVPRSRQTLQGTPTSPGYCTGVVKIVRGLGEFPKLAAGDVLVIPYSDVGWTPLFARAGAVVAESGGMLSHSSIIAREYGIPAVVSVDGALGLPESATVTVNGYTGEVILHQEETLCAS